MAAISVVSARRPVLKESTGERIRRLRLARGWSQRDLADRAYVSTFVVWRAEGGHNLYAYTLAAIADALDVSLDALWRGDWEAS